MTSTVTRMTQADMRNSLSDPTFVNSVRRAYSSTGATINELPDLKRQVSMGRYSSRKTGAKSMRRSKKRLYKPRKSSLKRSYKKRSGRRASPKRSHRRY